MVNKKEQTDDQKISTLEKELEKTQEQLKEVLNLLKPNNETVDSSLEDPEELQTDSLIEENTIENEQNEEKNSVNLVDYTQNIPQNPHISSWEVSPSPYSPESNIVTFFLGETPLAHLEINSTRAGDLVERLNQEIAYLGDEIDKWYIKTPDNPSVPPLLHLAKNEGVVNTIELNDDFMKEIMPLLLKIHNPLQKENRFLGWLKRHRIISSILIAFFTIIFGYTIFSYFF